MYNFEYIAVEEVNEHLHVYGLIDWLVYNANFSNISAISSR